jgi:SAM-dependent methyltransferase
MSSSSAEFQNMLMDVARKLLPSAIKRHLRWWPSRTMEDADRYVATDKVSGLLQFDLVKREGCKPDSRLLEIGCGNLHGAVPLIEYLREGNYVGIDPNEWLRKAAMKDPYVHRLCKEKKARFLNVDDFDASSLGIKFDFVFSHSVLSHCAHWQLEVFLRNVCKVLAPGGRILASIRLAEGNVYGSTGGPDMEDSRNDTWQYQAVSWFKLSTVREAAEKHGMAAVHIPKYTELYVETRPEECHDWLVLHWKS